MITFQATERDAEDNTIMTVFKMQEEQIFQVSMGSLQPMCIGNYKTAAVYFGHNSDT